MQHEQIDIFAMLERNGGPMELTAILTRTGLPVTELFIKLDVLEALGKITVTPQQCNKSALVAITPPKPKPKTSR